MPFFFFLGRMFVYNILMEIFILRLRRSRVHRGTRLSLRFAVVPAKEVGQCGVSLQWWSTGALVLIDFEWGLGLILLGWDYLQLFAFFLCKNTVLLTCLSLEPRINIKLNQIKNPPSAFSLQVTAYSSKLIKRKIMGCAWFDVLFFCFG